MNTNPLKNIIKKCFAAGCIAMFFAACSTPILVEQSVNRSVPAGFNSSRDTTNSADVKWKDYFTDPFLNALIDTALLNNQELNITMQEIEISKNEVMARKGEYLPFVNFGGGMGVDKVARYTSRGASEATTEIDDGKEMPEPLADFIGGAYATWEVDIWHKLRNAKKAAFTRYLASVEGRNFLVTNLIAEIANSYYELLALDNQLEIVQQNIEIQRNALEIVKVQKEASRVTELAVRKFEAEVFNTRSLQYDIQQSILETENRINFLVGRFPQPVRRNSQNFNNLIPAAVQTGIPSQLMENRPDIRQAELELQAAKIDIEVARANFYPSLGLSASFGLQAFNPTYLIKLPESLLATLTGDLIAPLVNKNAIKAIYFNANASQIQAIYNYERTVLNAYIEVANQLSNINNLELSYDLKSKQVEALSQSIDISNDLFKSARADYMEVLLTQRDALESKFELVETKKRQLSAFVNMYHALGGGWN
jgi:NodT family efflux transporter outer membrane factor (OMF) lipoprotein